VRVLVAYDPTEEPPEPAHPNARDFARAQRFQRDIRAGGLRVGGRAVLVGFDGAYRVENHGEPEYRQPEHDPVETDEN
jgi:hypothetical protein